MEEEKVTLFSPSLHRVFIDGVIDCRQVPEDLVNVPPKEEAEIRAYSKQAHNRDILGYDKTQNALCFVVIGGIVLTIGILFIFLSLKKKVNKIVGINVNSFQFVICVVCLAIGLGLLITGITLLIKALSLRKRAKKEISYISKLQRGE
ncbi:MAG TPA: hypothetical protein DCR94_06675 [Firmicutes bacterium]|nr:hypothetical protein [Bacillota bacterium]